MIVRFFTPALLLSVLLICSAEKDVEPAPRYSFGHTVVTEDDGATLSEQRVSFDFSPRADLAFQVRVPESRKAEIGSIVNRLMATHLHIEKLLGRTGIDLKVSLLNPHDFYVQTGAPEWVNAMYFKGTIIVPISESSAVATDSFERTIRHEYFHAVIDKLTKGVCPGWIEEGFAQIIEGKDNDALANFYYGWVRTNGMLPFENLQHGFTDLGADLAPVAYAQSVFAVKMLLNKFGYPAMRSYFSHLGAGVVPSVAFERAFGIDEFYFQDMLTEELRGMYI